MRSNPQRLPVEVCSRTLFSSSLIHWLAFSLSRRNSVWAIQSSSHRRQWTVPSRSLMPLFLSCSQFCIPSFLVAASSRNLFSSSLILRWSLSLWRRNSARVIESSLHRRQWWVASRSLMSLFLSCSLFYSPSFPVAVSSRTLFSSSVILRLSLSLWRCISLRAIESSSHRHQWWLASRSLVSPFLSCSPFCNPSFPL